MPDAINPAASQSVQDALLTPLKERQDQPNTNDNTDKASSKLSRERPVTPLENSSINRLQDDTVNISQRAADQFIKSKNSEHDGPIEAKGFEEFGFGGRVLPDPRPRTDFTQESNNATDAIKQETDRENFSNAAPTASTEEIIIKNAAINEASLNRQSFNESSNTNNEPIVAENTEDKDTPSFSQQLSQNQQQENEIRAEVKKNNEPDNTQQTDAIKRQQASDKQRREGVKQTSEVQAQAADTLRQNSREHIQDSTPSSSNDRGNDSSLRSDNNPQSSPLSEFSLRSQNQTSGVEIIDRIKNQPPTNNQDTVNTRPIQAGNTSSEQNAPLAPESNANEAALVDGLIPADEINKLEALPVVEQIIKDEIIEVAQEQAVIDSESNQNNIDTNNTTTLNTRENIRDDNNTSVNKENKQRVESNTTNKLDEQQQTQANQTINRAIDGIGDDNTRNERQQQASFTENTVIDNKLQQSTSLKNNEPTIDNNTTNIKTVNPTSSQTTSLGVNQLDLDNKSDQVIAKNTFDKSDFDNTTINQNTNQVSNQSPIADDRADKRGTSESELFEPSNSLDETKENSPRPINIQQVINRTNPDADAALGTNVSFKA